MRNDSVTVTYSGLHIFVGAWPSWKQNISLAGELPILKSALLYADKVTYCSVTAAELQRRVKSVRENLTPDGLLHFTDSLIAEATDTDVETLRARKPKTAEQRAAAIRAEQTSHEICQYYYDEVDKEAVEAGLFQLSVPSEAGVLEISQLEGTGIDLFKSYIREVVDNVWSGTAYPMLDLETADQLSHAISRGAPPPSRPLTDQAKHVNLSSDLLRRLPLFDSASIDEILDIRRDLEAPLIKFRSAIIDYTQEIQSAPWDSDFPIESNRIFIRHVAPTVSEIEEQCRSRPSLREFLPSLLERATSPAVGSCLGLVVANSEDVSKFVSAGIGAMGGLAVEGLKAYNTSRRKRREVEKNSLFFYYEAGKRLDNS